MLSPLYWLISYQKYRKIENNIIPAKTKVIIKTITFRRQLDFFSTGMSFLTCSIRLAISSLNGSSPISYFLLTQFDTLPPIPSQLAFFALLRVSLNMLGHLLLVLAFGPSVRLALVHKYFQVQ